MSPFGEWKSDHRACTPSNHLTKYTLLLTLFTGSNRIKSLICQKFLPTPISLAQRNHCQILLAHRNHCCILLMGYFILGYYATPVAPIIIRYCILADNCTVCSIGIQRNFDLNYCSFKLSIFIDNIVFACLNFMTSFHDVTRLSRGDAKL